MMHKRLLLIIVCVLLWALPTVAQTDVEWYGLHFQMPESWTSTTTDSIPPQLVLGSDDAVADVLANQPLRSAVITIQPTLEIRSMRYTTPFARQDTIETDIMIGDVGYQLLLFPAINDTQIAQFNFAESVLVTLAAPTADWDSAQAEFATVLQSLRLDALTIPSEMLLGQTIALGDIVFDVPLSYWSASVSETMRMYTSQDNRGLMGSTFQANALTIITLDLSSFRPFITADNLTDFPAAYRFAYISDITPESIQSIEDFSIGTYSGKIVSFGDDTTVGRALILLDEHSAFLIGGGASRDAWDNGDAALFDAILATMRQASD